MARTDGDDLADLPPSAKLVYKVLEYDGPLTQRGIVEEDIYFADARQNLYELDTGDCECDPEPAPSD